MAPNNSNLARFLSDFTLGFADGLTVPFALTAGLSSLGKTDTVISGGLAELCAGTISMGIGGYLAARDELPQPQTTMRASDEELGDEEEGASILHGRQRESSGSTTDVSEKNDAEAEEAIRRHLEPLALPSHTVTDILVQIQEKSGSLGRAALRLQCQEDEELEVEAPVTAWTPILSGLSIAFGYLAGALIPLCPYFFTSTVGRGLQWSIALCSVALFLYGTLKSVVLKKGRSRMSSLWEGLQMLILGVVAAGAAVLCVRFIANDGGK